MAEKKKNGEQEQSLSQILKVRRDKLKALQEAGKDPFEQTKFVVSNYAQEIKDNFDAMEGQTVTVAGRIMFKRGMGKVSFFDMQDKTGRIQLYARRDEMDEAVYADVKKYDIGDIVGVKGVGRNLVSFLASGGIIGAVGFGIVIRIQQRTDFINGDIAVDVAFGGFQKISRRSQTIDLLKSDSCLPSLSLIPLPRLALQQILIKFVVFHIVSSCKSLFLCFAPAPSKEARLSRRQTQYGVFFQTILSLQIMIGVSFIHCNKNLLFLELCIKFQEFDNRLITNIFKDYRIMH